MGLRKLIYIPDDIIWDSIKMQAAGENRSVSNYLVNLHKIYTQGKIISQDWRSGIKPDPKLGKKK